MGKFNYFSPEGKRINRLSHQEQTDLVFDLINAFALMKTPVDSALLLQDLLTESEVINLAKRLRIAKLILGGMTHEDIVSQLHCSYATVSKVKIWLESSGQGLKKVIKKLPERSKVSLPRKTPGVGYGLPTILAYYASSAVDKKERKQLENFLGSMRGKSSGDKDLRQEINKDFRESRPK